MRLFAIATSVFVVVVACGGSAQTGLDGGGTDAGTSVLCGTTTCASGQSCCVDTSQQPTSYTCMTGSCPWPADTLGCAGNDCGPSQVCCVFQLTNSTDVHSECRPNCLGNDVAQLCQMNATVTGCPSNAPCGSSNIDTWWLEAPFGTCGDASCCGF